MVDGGCPVVRDNTRCPDRPIAARLVIATTPDGATVALADTDAAGHFRVPLGPGTYAIHPANRTGAVVPTAAIVTVTVTSGQFTDITIHFDSGIR